MKLAFPSCKQVKKALKSLGFYQLPQRTGTSHEKFRHDCFKGERRTVTVDCPKQPFGHDLLASMAHQAGLSKKDFWRLCCGRLSPDKIKP
ncbi:type II toxin-antitoxin system HicA family toxin [Alcanivorax sp.]|uniref:type II toxin-antitoxin system HicA family toxin n=1 Tax=Alcanivorax sp. TaxID=1872427 RepID=UPI003A93EA5B